MTKKYYGGCDVGSTTGKAAILDENGSIISTIVVPSEIDPEITSIQALENACAQVADLNSYKDLARIVGTGYGRNEVVFANEIGNLLGHNGLKVLSRVMGVILLAVSVDFLVEGIRQAFYISP